MITVTRPWSGKIEARASVDQDGNWRIDGLVKGEYRVQARKQGYSSEAFDDIPADSDNLHFTLRENGNLIGSVTAPDGTPVTRFSVSLLPVHDGTPAAIQRSMRLAKPARAFADEGGNFHWADIDPGHYNVTVRTQNYPDWTEDNVHIPSGSAGSITVRMKAGGAIVGRVIDPNGNGLVDAIITARPKLDRSNPSAIGRAKALATQFEGKGEGVDGAGGGKLTTRPTPDGSYAIRGLEPGEYTLHIQSTRYVAPPVEAVVVAEEQETRRDFTMGLAGQLTVTVTDDFNDPVVGAAVIIRDPATGRKPLSVRGGPRTDQRGSVTLTGVPSGTFKITVNRSGYMIKEINVNVAAGAEMSESVQIEKIR